MKTMAKVVSFCNLLYPVAKIRRVRKSIESRVHVLATANRIWVARESFSPIATVEGRTSQACRFQPYLTCAMSITATNAVVGSYPIVRYPIVEGVEASAVTIARRMKASS
jgi:hypothetical protein